MRAVLEIVVWWVVLTGVWLTTLNAYSTEELVASAALALPCAFAARAGRHAAGVTWRARPGWFRWLLALPGAVVADTIGLVRVSCGRRATGEGDEFRELRLPHEEDTALRYGREALTTAAVRVPSVFSTLLRESAKPCGTQYQ